MTNHLSPGSRSHLAAHAHESFIRSSPDWRVFIHNHRDWNARQHRRKFALATKGREECTILELGQDFYRDAARDVDAAKRHSLQCEIPRHPAKYSSPEPHRLHASRSRQL